MTPAQSQQKVELGMLWGALRVKWKDICAKSWGWDIHATNPGMRKITLCAWLPLLHSMPTLSMIISALLIVCLKSRHYYPILQIRTLRK